MMEAAMDHDGFSVIECLSECVEFYEGAFDASNGNVLYGPPPRPLDVIEIEMREGQVWAVSRKAASDEHAV